MSTALLELDTLLRNVREQYIQESDIDSVKELNTIIKINRALTDANVSVFDTFTILLKQLQISTFANREQEVFWHTYNVVHIEFQKYKDATEQETLAALPVFNMADELEKIKVLTAQLEAVIAGIVAPLGSKASAALIESEHEKAKALTAQIKTVFERFATHVDSEDFTARLEASIEEVSTKLGKVIRRNDTSSS